MATSVALLALFRSEMKDNGTPALWSDADVYTYLADAESMFCRLTDGIADATTSAIVDITVAAAATWLNLSPLILKIRGATRTSDGKELAIVNYEDLEPRGIKFDGSTGKVETLIVGMEENKLRLSCVNSTADAIKMIVFRRPLLSISASQDPEIGSQHHYHLLKWAKALALLKQDAETFDKSKSIEFEQAFRSYCDQVKTEQANKRHKVRVVSYGGI